MLGSGGLVGFDLDGGVGEGALVVGEELVDVLAELRVEGAPGFAGFGVEHFFAGGGGEFGGFGFLVFGGVEAVDGLGDAVGGGGDLGGGDGGGRDEGIGAT